MQKIRKPFKGVVKPSPIVLGRGQVVTGRATKKGPAQVVEIPAHDQVEASLGRIEATRQWLIQHGELGKTAASLLMEQAIRLQALRSYIAGNFPQGEIRTIIEKILDGKITAIPVD